MMKHILMGSIVAVVIAILLSGSSKIAYAVSPNIVQPNSPVPVPTVKPSITPNTPVPTIAPTPTPTVASTPVPTVAPAPASTPNTDQITTDILERVASWSTSAPSVQGLWYYGQYAEVAYNTGESGGTAIYSSASGTWQFVCGGGGALDQASAVASCGLSANDAAGLLPQ